MAISCALVLSLLFAYGNVLGAPQVSSSATPATTTSSSTASAATHSVSVGANGLTFTPNSVTAATGDTVVFIWGNEDHSVTQSSFDAPCSHLVDGGGIAVGIDSGLPINVGSVWAVEVTNASQSVWIYCREPGHCPTGMVMAINPTAAQTVDAFTAAAKAVSIEETWTGETNRLNGTGVSANAAPGQPLTSSDGTSASAPAGASTSRE
ncbi:hypothetical protein MNV49_001793 [Pseudohyphozyma bogoriensis]|nr:hypothetical protein MNV49_001793 [Pseudohyphozyma bogoriensis]